MKIPLAKPELGEEEILAVTERLRSGWIAQGPKVSEFENAWAKTVGCKSACAVSSCTTALHLALLCLGIGSGDEVLVPAFTWIDLLPKKRTRI